MHPHATPIADVRDAAAVAGGESFQVSADGTQHVDFRNGWGAARFLLELARRDARRPWVVEFARWMRERVGGSDLAFAQALQGFGQRLPFFHEEGEIFQGPALTAERGGDCDCHARMVFAIAKAGGLPAELAFMHKGGNPSHVYARAFVSGAWRPLETTVGARFGEDPFKAAKRLGVVRKDIAPEIITMGETGNPDDPNPTIEELDAELQDELRDAAAGAGTIGALTPPTITGETSQLDDAFFVELVRQEKEDGGTAEMRAGLLLAESGLQPAIKNSIGCVGLNQFCPGTLEDYWKGTADEYRALSASQQIQIIRRFWRMHANAHGPTVWDTNGRNLYWVNFVPDSYNGAVDDSWLIASGPRTGDDKKPATWDGSQDIYFRPTGQRMPYHGLLKANPGFVTVEGSQRVIRAGALSRAIANAKLANPHRWAETQARIAFARGGAGGGSVGAGAGAGAAVAVLTLGALGVLLAKYLA